MAQRISVFVVRIRLGKVLYWVAGALASGIFGFAFYGMIVQHDAEHLFKMLGVASLAFFVLVLGKAAKEWLIASAKSPPRVRE